MTNETKLMETLKQDGMTISAADLLTYDLEKLSTDEVHFLWSILDLIEKASKTRKDESRDRLLTDAKEYGNKNDKGSFILEVEMGKVTAQRKLAKAKVEQKAVRELLLKKGIPVNSVLVKKTVQEFDVKAFEAMVKDGQISEEEKATVMGTAKESFSLVVEKPGFLPRALAAGSGAAPEKLEEHEPLA
jgi:hypothetical protein